jgi:hypothetical protein
MSRQEQGRRLHDKKCCHLHQILVVIVHTIKSYFFLERARCDEWVHEGDAMLPFQVNLLQRKVLLHLVLVRDDPRAVLRSSVPAKVIAGRGRPTANKRTADVRA